MIMGLWDGLIGTTYNYIGIESQEPMGGGSFLPNFCKINRLIAITLVCKNASYRKMGNASTLLNKISR